MPDLTRLYMQKVQLPNGTEYWVKDAAAWEVLKSFFGEPVVGEDGAYHFPKFQGGDSEKTLQQIIQEIVNNEYITNIHEAAEYDVVEQVNASSDDQHLPTAKAVWDALDSAIDKIPEFDVIVIPRGENLPTASENTFHKIYLQNASEPAQPNLYKEWITIRSGQGSEATYSWELIGDTSMSLDGFAQEDWVEEQIRTIEIAGVTVHVDSNSEGYVITAAELKNALGLKALAYKDSASGTVGAQTLHDVKARGNVTADITGELNYNPTNISVATASYTPAGEVSVTLGFTSTGITSTGSITAEGSVSAATTSTVLADASLARDGDGTQGGVQIGGVNSASAVSFQGQESETVLKSMTAAAVAPSFEEGEFTPASFKTGFATPGTAASLTTTYTAPALTTASYNAASDAVVASYQGADETLVFSTPTINAINGVSAFNAGTFTATFTPNTPTAIDTTKFDGGSKADDTFDAGSAATFDTVQVVKTVGTATAAAQVFTGDKYYVQKSTDSVMKTASFTGSPVNVSVSGNYDKAKVDDADFTGAATTVVTGGTYDRAGVTGATLTVEIGDITLTVDDFTITQKTVTVE